MHPVVLREVAAKYLVVPDGRVLDPGVTESERDRIVPGWSFRRRVDRDLGRFLKHDSIHVRPGDLASERRDGAIVQRLHRHAVERCLATNLGAVGKEEGTTA